MSAWSAAVGLALLMWLIALGDSLQRLVARLVLSDEVPDAPRVLAYAIPVVVAASAVLLVMSAALSRDRRRKFAAAVGAFGLTTFWTCAGAFGLLSESSLGRVVTWIGCILLFFSAALVPPEMEEEPSVREPAT